MIGFLRGIVANLTMDSAIIDVGGVGYNVMITSKVAQKLPGVGSETKVYTYLSVREDAMKLYGFYSADELEMFKKLITVNGIGPKNALGVLSVMEPNDLRFAILSGDAKTISKCPGIGAKSAQKVILELKDKVDFEETINSSMQSAEVSEDISASRNEAVQALTALGYSATEAMKAVKSVPTSDNQSIEDILKAALKYM